MPIYDYSCQDCGKVSEILTRGAENQTIHCPECGSDNMLRLMTSSYMIKMGGSKKGNTCCGSEERCSSPPCSTGNTCRRA